MTTAAAATRSSTAGNGTTTAFQGAFRANSAAEVGVVTIDTTTKAATVPTLNVDYTVSINATTGVPTVTFTTAPASGTNVIIYANNTVKQDESLDASDPLYGTSIEEAVDKIAAMLQSLQDEVRQCVRFPKADTAVTSLASLQAFKDKYFYGNATTGLPEPKDLATIQASLGILDADLAAIAALTPSNNDFLQYVSGAWLNQTPTQAAADVGAVMPDDVRYASDTDTGFTRSAVNAIQTIVGGLVAAQINANGLILPLQPSFLATVTSDVTNVTGNGAAYTILFDTEVYDRNSDYAPGTGIFTAPVTGLYDFSGSVSLLQAGSATQVLVELVTSNRTYRVANLAGGAVDVSNGVSLNWAVNGADMDVNDTARVRVTVTGEGADTTDIDGDATNALTFFSGRLVA